MALPDQAGLRYTVQALLDDRTFEKLHVDVGIGNAVTEPPEFLFTTALLDFAGLPLTRVACYPVTQQIAEKPHAYIKSMDGVNFPPCIQTGACPRFPCPRFSLQKAEREMHFQARGIEPLTLSQEICLSSISTSSEMECLAVAIW
jgi:hypothetical protein